MSYGFLVIAAFLTFSATRVELGAEFRIGALVLAGIVSIMAIIAGLNVN